MGASGSALSDDKPIEQKLFQPCNICIDSIRKNLYGIKNSDYTDFNKKVKDLTDLYTGADFKEIADKAVKFNIEHVVPAHILSPRSRSSIYINEAYYDIHLVFPTVTTINSIRGNNPYGDVVGKEGFKYTQIYPEISTPIDENKKMYIGRKQQEVFDHTTCNGTCLVQPSNEYKGEIARIVFYYYLMYAYDITKRPNTGQEPWFINIRKKKCLGFNIGDWDKFFYEHLDEYYKWASVYGVSDAETTRNKLKSRIMGIPNIFVGYYNGKEYKKSTMQIIDDLLFGAVHDHDTYTKIDFGKPIIGAKIYKHLVIRNKKCETDIIQLNKSAMATQKKRYKFSAPVVLSAVDVGDSAAVAVPLQDITNTPADPLKADNPITLHSKIILNGQPSVPQPAAHTPPEKLPPVPVQVQPARMPDQLFFRRAKTAHTLPPKLPSAAPGKLARKLDQSPLLTSSKRTNTE